MDKQCFKLYLFLIILSYTIYSQEIVWEIEQSDNSAQGMALYPNQYQDYIKNDFGFENGFFLIGFHKTIEHWPYVLPHPKDGWAGTGTTSGTRSHFQKIDFELPALDSINKPLWTRSP